MKKFLSLPQEKQDRIVTVAMTKFGEVGYKKAYISEIAEASGISKALIFHYFGTKKSLYSYLVYYTGKVVMTEAQHERETAGKDFFDRALAIIKFRLSIKSRYPAMSSFIDSVYNESDSEVATDIERLLTIATDMHKAVAFAPGEEKTLKSNIDTHHVVALISRYSDGIMASIGKDLTPEEAIGEVEICLDMLRAALCRP